VGERDNHIARWYAIYTRPRQENRAECNLNAWRVETFFPRLKERRHNRYTNQITYQIKPLFPRYFFAHFDARSLLHGVSLTRGVRSVVSFGSGPAEVNEEIITMIRSHIGDEGYVRLDENLTEGDEVVISEGPLAGVTGIFQKRMKSSERVMLLLAAVSYQGRVVIDRALLEKSNGKPTVAEIRARQGVLNW